MCAIEKSSEIEVTPEMANLGADIILSERGVADFGVFFSAPDLAARVFQAMESARLSLLDQ
jgi:hypothetical protein